MNSPLNLINKRFNNLSKSEKTVAEFVQKHIDEVVLLTTQGIASRCKTSDATVIRFCRSLGYQTFNEFKTALVPELLRSGKSFIKEIDNSSKSQNITQTFSFNLKQQIDFTIDNLEINSLKQIADQIIKSKRMVIVGIGGAAGVGYIFNDSLSVLGIYSNFLSDRSIIQSIIPTLNSNDLVFAISHSGETDEIVSALKAAHEYGTVTIALTNFLSSPLTNYANYILYTSVPDNLLGSFSCQSRISQLALLELVLIEIKNKLASKKKN
ncbi:MAG: MurR/RpiR family transcriptional regulator [Ignavibacteriae bacterium]|nr:MurR/RpiR family transcriptional regulator [Ignavibacteriota bacterium]